MDDIKAGVAVLVKTRFKEGDGWKDGYAFGGHFGNIAESLGYLQFLEKRETEFIVQIGWVGWRKSE